MNIFPAIRGGESSKGDDIKRVPTIASSKANIETIETDAIQPTKSRFSLRSAMATSTDIWVKLAKDGKDRSNIPPISQKLFIIRLVQLGLAVAFLILAAFSAFTLNLSNVRW
jgi:hypothetical protein